MATVPYSPVRPDFIRLERLIWSTNATRYTTTERRGGAVHLEDQGKGHAAEAARLRAALDEMTAEDLADYMAWYKHMQAIREA